MCVSCTSCRDIAEFGGAAVEDEVVASRVAGEGVGRFAVLAAQQR